MMKNALYAFSKEYTRWEAVFPGESIPCADSLRRVLTRHLLCQFMRAILVCHSIPAGYASSYVSGYNRSSAKSCYATKEEALSQQRQDMELQSLDRDMLASRGATPCVLMESTGHVAIARSRKARFPRLASWIAATPTGTFQSLSREMRGSHYYRATSISHQAFMLQSLDRDMLSFRTDCT